MEKSKKSKKIEHRRSSSSSEAADSESDVSVNAQELLNETQKDKSEVKNKKRKFGNQSKEDKQKQIKVNSKDSTDLSSKIKKKRKEEIVNVQDESKVISKNKKLANKQTLKQTMEKAKVKGDKAKVVKTSDSDESSEPEADIESDMEYPSDIEDIEEMDTQSTGDSGSEDFSEHMAQYHRKIASKQNVGEEIRDFSDVDDGDGDKNVDYGDDDFGAMSDDGDDDGNDVTETKNKNQNEEDEYTAIRKELSDIPFEDLLKIKEKVGVKAFNKILHGNVDEKPMKKVFKRTNKHKPREMSSKRPVSGLVKKIETKPAWTSRDPRFDDLSGQFEEEHFAKNYSFIEDIKETERKKVKKVMKKSKNEEKKRDLKFLLTRMEQEQKVKENKQKKQELERTYKAKEKELVKEGKKPYFLKNSDKKTLELAMKFKELKQAGRLDSYMSKKRKKVAQKQRKKMPSKHS